MHGFMTFMAAVEWLNLTDWCGPVVVLIVRGDHYEATTIYPPNDLAVLADVLRWLAEHDYSRRN